MGYEAQILVQMGLLGHGREIWVGRPRSQKNIEFHFIHQDLSRFSDGRAPQDDGGFPEADPPSDTEDDCGDKRTAVYQQQGQDVFF
jgi:hypothetical protein